MNMVYFFIDYLVFDVSHECFVIFSIQVLYMLVRFSLQYFSLSLFFLSDCKWYLGFSGGPSGKEPTCRCRRRETRVWSLGREDPLEESMATHSSILAWRIPWTEEHGRVQSIVLQRVRHDWSDLMRTHTLSHKRYYIFYFVCFLFLRVHFIFTCSLTLCRNTVDLCMLLSFLQH